MMTMTFNIELDGPAGEPTQYVGLEISRDATGSIVFKLLGVGNRVMAIGTCEASELARMAEILCEPEDHQP